MTDYTKKRNVMNEDERTKFIIWKTKNYDQFKYFKSNREVTVNQKLSTEIKTNNRLHSHPIVVDKNMYVLDGQHRLDIAREMKIDIYYIIDEMGCEDDIRLTQGSKNWSQNDYLNFHKSHNVAEYIFIDKIINEYDVKLNRILKCFITATDSYSITSSFKSGKIKFRIPQDEIIRIISDYKEISDTCNLFIQKPFYSTFHDSILILLQIKEFSKDRFIEQINRSPDHLIVASKFNSIKNVKDALLRIYNKWKRNDVLEIKTP